MIGVGAGQQSRVDCVKLAGRKVATWYLRQHPKVVGLQFKAGTKRQARVNARVRYIEGDMVSCATRLRVSSWMNYLCCRRNLLCSVRQIPAPDPAPDADAH